jgi:biotin transport system substrate-specific component
MNQELLASQQVSSLTKNQVWMQLISIVLGSVFLGLMAQLAFYLPWTPIPVTLQTLGVSILAIGLGPRQAFLSVLLYLGQATIGLPVIAGGLSNPLWIMGPTAGYLMGFLVASYLTGQLLKKQSSSLFKTVLIFALNEGIILFIGFVWLAFIFNQNQAFQVGFLPFIPGAVCKALIATSLLHPIRWIQSKI